MTKTLVLFGSARKNGETKAMLNLLLESLGDKAGDVNIIDAYQTEIQPCIDCRCCWEYRGCSINDEMQEIYEMIDKADTIIIAAPVYYYSVPGKLKILIDRLQVYWAGIPRGDKPENMSRRGIGLLTGGAQPFPNQFFGAELVLKGVFAAVAAENVGIITFSETDTKSVNKSAELRDAIFKLADKFPDHQI